MRITLCLVMIVLLLVGGSIVFAAPILRVDEETYDFGKVLQGEKVPHVFGFVNEGDETLVIDRVRSSCGCTAVLVSEKIIAPGERGEIRANFDSHRFRGLVEKTIYLYSNDPLHPTKQLHLSGKVMELVAIKPPQVNFGVVKAGETVAKTVRLHNQGDKPLTLGKPTSTAVELVPHLEGASFAGNAEITLDLRLTPKPGHERFSGYVLIPVDGVLTKELRIPVYATLDKP